MLSSVRIFGTAALLAASLQTGAFAQDTDEAQTPAVDPATDLAIAEDQPGVPYVKQTEGAWELRCVNAPEGVEEDPCQMYQLLVDDNDQPIIEVSIFRLPEGGRAVAGATVVAPLETALQSQLTIVIDGGQARRYPFAFCNRVGCYARIGFTANDIAAFRAGKEATVTIVPALAPDQRVDLPMSLIGFTAIYNASSVLQQN